jgi:hypothetical protein
VKTWKILKKQKKKLEKRTPKKFLNSRNDTISFSEDFRKLSEFSDFPFNSSETPWEGTFKNLTLKRLLKAGCLAREGNFDLPKF